MTRIRSASLAGLALLPALTVSLPAQSRGLEFTYGAWQPDTFAIVWTAGYFAPLIGPLGYGLSLSHVDDARSQFNRSLTGAELSLGLGRDGAGPYLISTAGLGMKHSDAGWDAHWSAGAGAELRLLPFLSLGAEARYRVEDQAARGFWRRSLADRSGLLIAGRVAILWPGRRASMPGVSTPSRGEVERRAREAGISRAGSALAADIVASALDAMGSPYRWGGNDAGGYDCSGLIQFAYGQHGIILPRTGREQARLGVQIEPRATDLNPGDILGFSVEGAGVSHVGLYVGNGQFIHSASDGVRLSSLTASDPDSLWWQRRWIAARRILR